MMSPYSNFFLVIDIYQPGVCFPRLSNQRCFMEEFSRNKVSATEHLPFSIAVEKILAREAAKKSFL